MHPRKAVVLAMAILMTWASPSTAQSPEVSSSTTPSDVYREVQDVAALVEHLRSYMGRPLNTRPPLDVSGVAPREVIYEANTLCEKVNRLGYEMIREVSAKPSVPNRQINPADVLAMVRVAQGQLQHIIDELDLTPPTTESETTGEWTPTDVYKALGQLNRQVNLMLEQRFSPSDVYEEVSLAVAYAAQLRSKWPGNRMPPEPVWVFGQQPADAYAKLLACLHLVWSIAQQENLEVLQLHVDEDHLKSVTPSDVYELASLLVAELTYLNRVLASGTTQRKSYYPGHKVPSDVCQRAGILQLQLQEISELVSNDAQQEGS